MGTIHTLTSWQSDTLNQELRGEYGENRDLCADGSGNLFASLNTEGEHTPVLDIDFPARLVPSATPGHFHLYLDGVSMPWEKYAALLTALADAKIISKHYLRHSLKREMTMVRKPGVEKVHFDFDHSSADEEPDFRVDTSEVEL